MPTPAPVSFEVDQLNLASVGIDSAKIEWGSALETDYSVVFSEGETEPEVCSGSSERKTNGKKFFQLSNLKPDTAYVIRVCALKKEESSLKISNGVVLKFRTNDLPPLDVSDLKIFQTPGDWNTVQISWGEATRASKYLFSWALGKVPPANCQAGPKTIELAEKNTHLLGLGSQYLSVRVCAVNKNKQPDVSAGKTLTAFMRSAPPADVSSPKVEGVGSNWAKISWVKPKSDYAKFKFVYNTGSTAQGCDEGGTETENLNFTLSGLTPGKKYFARICALNRDEFPNPSQGAELTFETQPAPIVPPSNLRCRTNPSAGSVTLLWSGELGKSYFISSSTAPTKSCLSSAQYAGTGLEYRMSVLPSQSSNSLAQNYYVRVCMSAGAGEMISSKEIRVTSETIVAGAVNPGSCSEPESEKKIELSFDGSTSGKLVTSSNQAEFEIHGKCSESGSNIKISGDSDGLAKCEGGVWKTLLNLSQVKDGVLTLVAQYQDEARARFVSPASFTVEKRSDHKLPQVTLASSSMGTKVDASNVQAFALSGTCSEDGHPVLVSGDAVASFQCKGKAWSGSVKFQSVSGSEFKVELAHLNQYGEGAPVVRAAFRNGFSKPVVTILSPSPSPSASPSPAVTRANVVEFRVIGSCGTYGDNIEVSIPPLLSAREAPCLSGKWESFFTLSHVKNGIYKIQAVRKSQFGGTTVVTSSFERRFEKGSIKITSPQAGFEVTGEITQPVDVKGTCGGGVTRIGVASAKAGQFGNPTYMGQIVNCVSGKWSARIAVSERSVENMNITAQDYSEFVQDAMAETQILPVLVKERPATNLAWSPNVSTTRVPWVQATWKKSDSKNLVKESLELHEGMIGHKSYEVFGKESLELVLNFDSNLPTVYMFRIISHFDSGRKHTSEWSPILKVEPNKPPIAVADEIAIRPSFGRVLASVLDNDQDPDGDALVITSVSKPRHGEATIQNGKSIFYSANSDYFGTDDFEYTISDGRGRTAVGKVTASIEGYWSPIDELPCLEGIVSPISIASTGSWFFYGQSKLEGNYPVDGKIEVYRINPQGKAERTQTIFSKDSDHGLQNVPSFPQALGADKDWMIAAGNDVIRFYKFKGEKWEEAQEFKVPQEWISTARPEVQMSENWALFRFSGGLTGKEWRLFSRQGESWKELKGFVLSSHYERGLNQVQLSGDRLMVNDGYRAYISDLKPMRDGASLVPKKEYEFLHIDLVGPRSANLGKIASVHLDGNTAALVYLHSDGRSSYGFTQGTVLLSFSGKAWTGEQVEEFVGTNTTTPYIVRELGSFGVGTLKGGRFVVTSPREYGKLEGLMSFRLRDSKWIPETRALTGNRYLDEVNLVMPDTLFLKSAEKVIGSSKYKCQILRKAGLTPFLFEVNWD